MKIHSIQDFNQTKIDGLILLSTHQYSDNRGFFLESWNENEWRKILKDNGQNFSKFVQDNHSWSTKGVLRGMHYQTNPYSQGKLIRCIKGEIFDVAIDIRLNSPSFGKWVGIYLSGENNMQLWIPTGFAHGFLTLSDEADVIYKVTEFWNKDCERSLNWKDTSIDIQWPIENIVNSIQLSTKDKNAPFLSDLEKGDLYE
tara:strand:+ start:272 stop:868 length:597 start_codon:yes stop_codon:yes gene_type:complete